MAMHIIMDRVKRICYLSPIRAAKVQASLRIHAVSPEPSLLAHTSSESRGTFRQKIRSWPLWMAGHAQLKFVMTECLKTQIRLTGLIYASFWSPYLKIVNTGTPEIIAVIILKFEQGRFKIQPEDHWSCIAHLIAEDMLKSAFIEEKKFKNIECKWFGPRSMTDLDLWYS